MAGLDAGRFAIGVAGGTGGERGQVKLPRRDGPTAELVARVIPSHNRDGGWLDHALESSATRSGKVPNRPALTPNPARRVVPRVVPNVNPPTVPGSWVLPNAPP